MDGPHGPYFQSERIDAYQETLERLKRDERVYPCTCTRADIARAASAPHAEDEGPTYPGTCAARCAADAEGLADRPFAWRFRVPEEVIRWEDLVAGPQALNPSRIGGDFVVGRSNGAVSYQLAVVHDDATMGINEVIRGDDLLSSTPRQLLLYDALGWNPPRFGHVPLAYTPDGKRLAKRDNAIKLGTLRAEGIDPRRLIGQIALSCEWTERMKPSTPHEWIDRQACYRFPASPWVITPESLAELGMSRMPAQGS